MTNVGEKIRELRFARGLSQTELAQAVGETKQTLYKYETGVVTNIPLPKLEALARALRVSPAALLGWEEEPTPAAAPPREIEPIFDALNGAGQKELCRYGRYLGTQEEYRAEKDGRVLSFGPPLPHFLTAAAAGYAAPVEGVDYELVERGLLTPREADYCIEIAGDSMEPYIRSGERVYVTRNTVDLREFDVGVFIVDGDALCKQWCKDYNGTLHLLSANPRREDANRSFPRSSGQSVVCLGKVLLPKKLPAPVYE